LTPIKAISQVSSGDPNDLSTGVSSRLDALDGGSTTVPLTATWSMLLLGFIGMQRLRHAF